MFQILHALSWLSFLKSMSPLVLQCSDIFSSQNGSPGEAQNLLAKTEFLLACG